MGGASSVQNEIQGASKSWTPQQQGLMDMTGVVPFFQYGNFGGSQSQGQPQPESTAPFQNFGSTVDPSGGNMLSAPPPSAGGTVGPRVGANGQMVVGSAPGPGQSMLGSQPQTCPFSSTPTMSGTPATTGNSMFQPPTQGGWFSNLQGVLEQLMGENRA